eukprot:jgi/Chlat1/4455/Chrsp29S04408
MGEADEARMAAPGTIMTLPAPPPGGLGVEGGAVVVSARANGGFSSAPEKPKVVPTQTKAVGIIHPPLDIRNIVDKTAQFVAKNGAEFEKRIHASNKGNVKFNFLNPGDPYHAYYQYKLKEYIEGLGKPPPPPKLEDGASANGTTNAGFAAALKEEAIREPAEPLEKPDPDQYLVPIPPGLTPLDLDVIKLTAQFVARNGKSFLAGLTSREHMNPQFNFLKPTHSLFTFFTTLADAYSKVLMPPKGLAEKLRKEAEDRNIILERIRKRLNFERSQDEARQRAEDEAEAERQKMAAIDWHDFVVVETIEFFDDEDEELPAPMTMDEVIRKLRDLPVEEEDEAAATKADMEMEMDDEEMDLVQQGLEADKPAEAAAAPTVPSVPAPETAPDISKMRIVRDYKRPEERLARREDGVKMVVSPITGELLPLSEMAEHMRVSLIDPKFKEQKERMMAKLRETTMANDDEITRNIVGLARTRPDIFGTTEEEVRNAVAEAVDKDKADASKPNGASSIAAPPRLGQPSPPVSTPPPPPVLLRPPNSAPPLLQQPIPQPRPQQYTPSPLQQYPAPPPPAGTQYPPGIPPHLLRPGGTAAAPSTQQQMPPHMQPPPMYRPPMPMPPGIPGMPPGMPPPLSTFAPPGTMPGTMPGIMPSTMPPAPPPPPPPPEEPEPKRQKLEEQLVPEQQFLAMHPGTARVTITVPAVEREGGEYANLKGQTVTLTVNSLAETITGLKNLLAAELGLPPPKQQIQGETGFLKDHLSLAHYNVAPGVQLSLKLKERGGRRR